MRIFLIFTMLLLGFACTESTQAQSKLNADQVENMLKANKPVLLLDVRTPAEIQNTGKIAGAVTINFSSPDFQAQLTSLDKEKPVIVYCAAGSRSPRAAAQMTKLGFKTVYDYPGGMSDWLSKGKKTVR
jgi:rhodanese-related sulfurtransferase